MSNKEMVVVFFIFHIINIYLLAEYVWLLTTIRAVMARG